MGYRHTAHLHIYMQTQAGQERGETHTRVRAFMTEFSDKAFTMSSRVILFQPWTGLQGERYRNKVQSDLTNPHTYACCGLDERGSSSIVYSRTIADLFR